jgi:hypothetical protein
VRSELIAEAGHAPQIERPDDVAALIEDFAVELDAGELRDDRTRGERPRGQGDRPKGDRGKRSERKDRDR